MEDFKHIKDKSCSWIIPQRVVDLSCRRLIEKGKVIIPRLLVSIFIIEYVFYVYLKNVLPDEMEFAPDLLKIFFYVFLVTAGLLIVQYVIYPRLVRRLKKSRLITKKYFTWSDRNIYWKWVQGYWIENDEEFPGLLNVIFKTKDRLYSICLPENETYHPEIIQFVDSCVPEIEPRHPETVLTLTKRQLVFCWSFTIAVTIIAAILFIYLLPFQYLFHLMLATYFIGPGTLSMIFILGKKFYKGQPFVYAFALNMFSFMLFTSIVILVELYKYHKIIEGN